MRFFRRDLFQAILALLLTGHVALAVLMSVWQPLHEKLHDCCDHHEEPHTCEVTLFAQGAVPLVAPPVVAPAPEETTPISRFASAIPAAFIGVAGHLIGGVLAHSPPRGP